MAREKALYREYLGWIHNLDGNFAEAEKTLLTGLELSLKIAPESALISQTKRLLADAYLGLQKFELAQKFAEEALAVAEKINERAEIAACWRVFARVAVHNSQNDKAREWFKKAIDLYAMITSRYELAVTRYLAAKSGLYEHGERSALLYLAKEYFESEEIKPYIDKVNSELAERPKPTAKPSGETSAVFIAESLPIKKIRELAEHVAASDMTVLLTGPTGSGKDQLARYIHCCSGRSGRFVAVNCAAVPDGMVEAELFGYCRGAFTNASADKPGLLETADGGTFYFNEIADTPIAFQAKLLEFLESREVRRLGSTTSKRVNVRLIAATNQDLNALMKENRFRFDLYHRLNEIPIALPPLSERPLDIAPLVRHFLTAEGFDFEHNGNLADFDELCRLLSSHDWPGNVRELRAEVRRLYQLHDGDTSAMVRSLAQTDLTERELLLTCLEKTGWNQSATARELGLTEAGVRYKIKKYALDRDSGSKSSSQ